MKFTKLLLLFLLLSPVSSGEIAIGATPDHFLHYALEKFIRTELYFGTTKADKSALTDAEWSTFVDEVITPRFPDGFTVVDGKGQWRSGGKIAKESSKIFIVVYSRKEREVAGKKVDEIREEYKKRFEQESVLRVDITKSVRVSF